MQMRDIIRLIETVTGMAKVYHVTPKRNLRKIMRDGLMPKIGARSRKIREKIPAIYVFPDYLSMEDALSNWLGDEFEDVVLSVLELNIPKDWIIKNDLEWESTILQTVPPENIRIVIADVDEHDGSKPEGVITQTTRMMRITRSKKLLDVVGFRVIMRSRRTIR